LLAESPAYICPDCTTQSDQESEDEEEQVQIIQEFFFFKNKLPKFWIEGIENALPSSFFFSFVDHR
jgi:hypothetical protein